ncbi:ParA family protein [Paenibacillus kyungheensis]|uniref:ParA family protein n=1 Tax=Paenibacillus kyungheensis TaxID=1452732 RepID=A0AAX3LW57_9BACL|nr:ParA family protein [Paenibacillus kyungheensis]WCT53835.1 ParA family protein [Paenibacillus kyungheensis]
MNKEANVISFINMKGGVGKTTLCREIALYLSERYSYPDGSSVKVLLVDIDPQANLTQSLLERFNKETTYYKEDKSIDYKCSVDNIFNKDMIGMTRKHVILDLNDNLDLIPGELETIFLQRQQNPSTPNKLMDYILEEKLREKYDFIFLDCPPTYSVYTEMSFYTSDYYFVPAMPDAYSVLGIDLLERVVKDIVHSQRNTVFKHAQPKNLGIMWTRVQLNTKPKQSEFIEGLEVADIVINNKIYIFESRFHESNKLSTSTFDKNIIDRNDKNLDEMMIKICDEFLKRVEVMNNDDTVEAN